MNDSKSFSHIFFMGIAGAGMSALAQYLMGSGVQVSGSDRFFDKGISNKTAEKLQAMGIRCYSQDGSGLDDSVSLVVASTAVEDTVPEVLKAKTLGIPFIRRSDLLAHIVSQKKTIAIGGTSGKSSTAAMLFTILAHAGLKPSLISGAGLVSLIESGYIGNAVYDTGEWLVIEADESDGSITQYNPEIGVLLNVDKDHKGVDELLQLFGVFKNNCRRFFITNHANTLAATLSHDIANDFATAEVQAGTIATEFCQKLFNLSFKIDGIDFNMQALGRHTMSNAAAAVATAKKIGVSLPDCATALAGYKGIYRRHQLIGVRKGITVIDDYAHNPAKCGTSIQAVQPLTEQVVAWFQPHGYGPTKFLKDDFIDEIAKSLRPKDIIWMSEIYYVGGSAQKDISANDLVEGIRQRGKNAFFTSNRNELVIQMRPHLQKGAVLLLMGARDPSLEAFAMQVFEAL